MTSSSRTEPPGWTTAATPASRQDLEPVGEREEGVAGRRTAPAPAPPPWRTASSAAATRDCWPAPDAHRLAVGDHGRWRSRWSGRTPARPAPGPATAPRVGVALVTTFQPDGLGQEPVRPPGPAPSSPRLRTWRVGRLGRGGSEQPGGLALGRQPLHGLGVEARGHDHVGLGPVGHGLGDLPGHRSPPGPRSRRRPTAGRPRAPAGRRSARSSATAAPHGLACFTMATAGRVPRRAAAGRRQLVDQAPGGVGVEDVEVGERGRRRAGPPRPTSCASPATR